MATILIVDDEERLRHPLKRYLELTFGWAVYEASTAHEAIELIPSIKPEGIVLDRRMPDEKGILSYTGDLVMRWLFDKQMLSDICVIMLTGYAEVRNASDALSMGAWQYLEKGLEPSDIYRLLAPGIALKRCNRLRTEVAADIGTPQIVSEIEKVVHETLAPDLFKVYFFLDHNSADMNRRFVKEIKDGNPFLYAGTRDEVSVYDPVLDDAGTLMAVRVVIDHSHACGVVAMESRQQGAFDPRWQEVLCDFADLVGLAATIRRANDGKKEANRRELESLRLLYRELRHRLNSSIATMYQHAEAIIETPGVNAPISAKAQVIRKHLYNLRGVMKELREATNQIDVIKQPCRLTDLVQELLGEMQLEFRPMEVTVGVEESKNSMIVIADRDKLEYSVRCILKNAAEAVVAAKAWKAAGVNLKTLGEAPDVEDAINAALKRPAVSRPDITMSFRQGGGCGEIEIRDEGIGFDADTKERLFAPLFSTKAASANSTNDGMGLFTVKRLIEAMDGKILAYSAGTGKGATFTIRLHLAPEGTV